MSRFAISVLIAGSMVFVNCATVTVTKPKTEVAVKNAKYDSLFAQKLAAALSKNDFKGAIALFDTLSEFQMAKTETLILKASVLISAGYLEQARNIANNLIAADKKNIEARYLLSGVEAASGNYKEQKLLLEAIERENPAYIPALNDLGIIAINNKALVLAGSYFDRVLSADPTNLDALNGRANVYRLQHKGKDAEITLTKAVELYPNNPFVYGERGRFYREDGKLQSALSDLQTADKLYPNSYWICYDLGRVYLDMSKNEEALKEFSKAVRINPNNFIAFVYSAGLKDRMGDTKGAIQDYQRLSELRPDYYFSFEGLGVLKMQQKDYEGAANAFLSAYKYAPKEYSYAMLAAVCGLKAGKKRQEIKEFVDSAMRKIDRSKIDYHVMRLFFDYAGDSDVCRRVNAEKDPRTKAQMLFYIASYYAIQGMDTVADDYFVQVNDIGRRDMIEWRLNESMIQDRNIVLPAESSSATNGKNKK